MNKADGMKPVIVILGPTGSGKTSLGVELAKQLDGEIISADSRAIYRGMDIGTAKPTLDEQQGIAHYGFDLVEPGERFTVADWKAYAEAKIADIRKREKQPIIVGGTGLYIDALVYDYHFCGPTGQKIGDFEQKSCSDRQEMSDDYLLIGIDWPTVMLRERLNKRIVQMFCKELYIETRKLVDTYSWDSQAMKSNIYRFAYAYMSGEMTLEEARKKCFYADYHLAKRQLTWFRLNKQIVWLPYKEIVPFVLKQYKI